MKCLLKYARELLIIPILVGCLAVFLNCGKIEATEVEILDSSYSVEVFATNKDGFDAPDGLLWKDGSIFMADEGGPAFRIWKKGGTVKTLSTSKDGIESPEDLVVDSEGIVYFTDDDAGGVWRISENGGTSLLAGTEKGLVSTEGIALSPGGDLLVGDGVNHKVFSVSMSGNVSVYLDADSGIKKPESMVFDEQGNLYIADNEDNVLYLLSPDKMLSRLIENREGFSPESIWYADGTVFITDSDNGKLFTYKKATGLKHIATLKGQLKKVSGITTDEDGNIYVSVQTHIDRKHSYILKIQQK